MQKFCLSLTSSCSPLYSCYLHCTSPAYHSARNATTPKFAWLSHPVQATLEHPDVVLHTRFAKAMRLSNVRRVLWTPRFLARLILRQALPVVSSLCLALPAPTSRSSLGLLTATILSTPLPAKFFPPHPAGLGHPPLALPRGHSRNLAPRPDSNHLAPIRQNSCPCCRHPSVTSQFSRTFYFKPPKFEVSR